MLRDRLRSNRFIARIDVAGWASILFALIFAFVALHSTVDGYRPAVDAAKTIHARTLPGSDREDAITIAIMRDGRYFLGSRQLRLEDLSSQIQAAVRSGSPPKVYLKVDHHARYSCVKAAIDQVHIARIQDVAFVTQPSCCGAGR